MAVLLTNAIDLQDGLGAQLQRRLEIFNLSKFLEVGFRLLPITNFDSNYGDGMKTNAERQNELNYVEKFFLPLEESNAQILSFAKLDKYVSKLSFEKMKFLIKVLDVISRVIKINLLITLSMPHKLRINFLEIHDATYQPKICVGNPVKIILHLPWARASLLPDRFVPLNWYKSILRNIIRNLKSMNLNYEIIMHTDASPNLDSSDKFIWSSQATKDYWLATKNVGFIANSEYAHLDIFEEFQEFENVSILENIPPSEVWQTFQNADVLILSNSSLSHVGALLFNEYLIGFIPDKTPYLLPNVTPIWDLELNEKEFDFKFKESFKYYEL